MRTSLLALALLTLLGCESDPPPDEPDAARVDAARDDAGPDASVCAVPIDAGQRALPDAGAVVAAPSLDCGVPTFAEGTGLRRRPYLQSVSATSARVAWTSTTMGRALVRVAPAPEGPWREIAASEELFDAARTVDDGVDYVAYDALVEGLEQGAAYCYEVVEDGVVLASGLRLDSAWTDAARPVRLFAFGDSGTGSVEQLGIRDRIAERMGDYDLFLHLGDMAYGDGTFGQFQEYFFDVYADAMHRVPTWPTIGNHEYRSGSGQPYLDVYYLPEVALRARDQERYYSFDYGNVHFISLDSNSEQLIPIALDTRGRVTDDMVDWLRDDLASTDAPWIVAFFHHTPFSSSERGINWQVVTTLLPVLEEGGVDIVLAGHDHHYERSAPIRDVCLSSAFDDNAVTYVTAGAGGASLRPATGDWFTARVESDVHSYLSLTIHGCVAHGEAIDVDGDVVDTFDVYGCE